jgi:hypothetical protein
MVIPTKSPIGLACYRGSKRTEMSNDKVAVNPIGVTGKKYTKAVLLKNCKFRKL